MVRDLELALRSFQDHLHLRLSQYRSHQNAILAPISKLPIEIFSHILYLSVTVHDWTTVPNWSITRLQELAQVAKAWKEVVLETPELWGVIKVHRRPSINSRWREDLDLVLARSRSAPLAVVYDINEGNYDTQMRHADMEEVEKIFTLVGEHVSRLQTLLYRGSLSPAMAAILQLPTPSLERFSVSSWSYYDPQGVNQLMLPLHLSLGQKLLHFEAQYVPLVWGDFKGLTSLRLVKVGAEKDKGKGNDELMENLLAVLQSCPDLESLSLEDMGSVMDRQSTGFLDERSIQRVLARSQRIDLSSLWSLTIIRLAPELALAILFAEQLIKPAFDRAFDHSSRSRLHIAEHCRSLRILNDEDESPEDYARRRASFELEMLVVDGEVTEGDALEYIFEFLQYPSCPMPVQLALGYGSSPTSNATCMIRFPAHILDQVVDLRLYGSRAHNPEVLRYLSQTQAQRNSNDELTWPCPRLASLWINHRKWKHILNFLERRYGPRPTADGSAIMQTRLPDITFRTEPSPDVLPRIEPFVERWTVVEL
ncbi:hypothetical protein FRB93_007682 [Tulasnella sp. JGI-2019a]|nr:hypothetical protein FRB93_007682 [Tulasnella sp. JGI-2019a]